MNSAVPVSSRQPSAAASSGQVQWQDLPQPQRQPRTSPPVRVASNRPPAAGSRVSQAAPPAVQVAESQTSKSATRPGSSPTQQMSGPRNVVRTAARATGPSEQSVSPAHADASAPPQGVASEKAEHVILFQKYFKSVGKRTYVAQLKVATNGNHYLVLTEASRIKGTDDIRKTRVFVYSEDFAPFFELLAESQRFIAANPVPVEIAKDRASFWRKVNGKRSNQTNR